MTIDQQPTPTALDPATATTEPTRIETEALHFLASAVNLRPGMSYVDTDQSALYYADYTTGMTRRVRVVLVEDAA